VFARDDDDDARDLAPRERGVNDSCREPRLSGTGSCNDQRIGSSFAKPLFERHALPTS
jgi:hypothetical protein